MKSFFLTASTFHPVCFFELAHGLTTENFRTEIPTLAVAAIDKLAKSGVRLVGVDLPSVDQLDSKDLPVHHALLHSGIYILESLWLEAVWPGTYYLIALPIKIVGGDAAPVRAALFPEEL
jgi:arylformamidase